MDPNVLTWPVVAAAVVGLLIRALKSDVSLTPTLPQRWRPLVALALGMASGVLQMIAQGTPWQQALLGGLAAGVLPIAGNEAISHGLMGDARGMSPPAAAKPPPLPLFIFILMGLLAFSGCTAAQGAQAKTDIKTVLDGGETACQQLAGQPEPEFVAYTCTVVTIADGLSHVFLMKVRADSAPAFAAAHTTKPCKPAQGQVAP